MEGFAGASKTWYMHFPVLINWLCCDEFHYCSPYSLQLLPLKLLHGNGLVIGIGFRKMGHWATGPLSPWNGLQSYWRCVQLWRKLLWAEGVAMGSPVSAVVGNLNMEFEELALETNRPDPGCGRGMLMTLFASKCTQAQESTWCLCCLLILSASSGKAQPNSSTIWMESGRPSSSLWSGKKAEEASLL